MKFSGTTIGSFLVLVILASFTFGSSSAAAEETISTQSTVKVASSSSAPGTAPLQDWDRLGAETATPRARLTLAGGQTGHGVLLGMQSCVFLDCSDESVAVLLPTLGGLAGLGGSLLYTSGDGITPGEAAALNAGTIWGGWLALATGLTLDLDGDDVIGLMMAGQIGGLAGSYFIAQALRPTAGDVRLVNTVGLWSAIYYLFITEGLLDIGQSSASIYRGLLVTTLFGGLAGAQFSSIRPMSDSRVGIISLAGGLGVLLGMAIPIISVGDDLEQRTVFGMATLGATVGLGAGYVLTQDWDDPSIYTPSSASLGIAPTLDGQGMVGTLQGSF